MEKISEIIRMRLKEAGVRYNSNDNISDFVKEGELEKLQQEVQDQFQSVLDSLVIDTKNDHNTQETAKRVAKSNCISQHGIQKHVHIRAYFN
jgi:GTP cyclohydrolase I